MGKKKNKEKYSERNGNCSSLRRWRMETDYEGVGRSFQEHESFIA